MPNAPTETPRSSYPPSSLVDSIHHFSSLSNVIPSASSRIELYSADDRYRSPNDGNTVPMSFPAFSGRFASSIAASAAAPEEMPTMSPSLRASSFAISIASSLPTWMISSRISVSRMPGMNPAPMPWILCGPGPDPLKTADSFGSTATTLTFGFLDLRYRPVPVTVPPVPTPQTRMSICPAVSSQISGPVVSKCTFGFAGFSNCCRMYAFLFAAPSSSAFITAPFIPFAGSVRTKSAPNALSKIRRSSDIDAGIVRVRSYPFAAAMNASPIPVFPDVGSTSIVFPGVMAPFSSASAIIENPMRSFTEQHGSMISSFAAISATQPSVTLFRYTIGVHPTSCVTLSCRGYHGGRGRERRANERGVVSWRDDVGSVGRSANRRTRGSGGASRTHRDVNLLGRRDLCARGDDSAGAMRRQR
eukprot:31036-Pelagococcus_subviridis.AAC.14